MAQFININILDLDIFPQADDLVAEHGAVFVEIDEGDASSPQSLDWSHLYTADELMALVETDGLHATVTMDSEDEAAQVFASAGWQQKKAYWGNTVAFEREEA